MTFAWVDSETRSPLDLTKVGGHKYCKHPLTDALAWAFALGDDEPFVWSPWEYWHFEPTDRCKEVLAALHEHARKGGYFIAWNAAFDRKVWSEVMVRKYKWPHLELEQWLCAQAQAEASNLPGQLGAACEVLGTEFKKDPKGKALIQLLCTGTPDDWNQREFETAENMGHFRRYALFDIKSMRDVWKCTRPLTTGEWAEYHSSERINDRGTAVDIQFARAAVDYAAAEFSDINGQLVNLTGDKKLTVNAHVRKANWLYEHLEPAKELQEATLKPPKKKGDPPRKSCDKQTREMVLEALTDDEYSAMLGPEECNLVFDFLELIEAGNSAAVHKFRAIVNHEYQGRVFGAYSFNGAGQTGRFSSRGIQQHNMIRDALDEDDADRAIDAIEAIIAGEDADALVEEFGFPISRLLARLVRPTFIAPDGKILVWGDYNQIEARKLPWLSKSRGGNKKLDLFRSGQDVYKYAALPIFGVKPDDINKEQRQIGKVAELSLLFGGAIGAFMAMGRGYGVYVRASQARKIVDTWRETNKWCVNFWYQLWDAAIAAYKSPGEWQEVGRVRYLYHPQLMRGTLICQLPCGRFLVYPQFKHEWKIYEDKDGNEREGYRTTYMCNRGYRKDLWYGILAENITQGSAASVLRHALCSVDDFAVLHTHDEIVGEVPVEHETEGLSRLEHAMLDVPDYYKGLPLSVEAESGPFYTK